MGKAAIKLVENTLDTVAREVLVALQRVLTGAAIGAARTAVRLAAIGQRHESIEKSARAVQDVTAKMRLEIESAAAAATQTAAASERVADIAREGRELSGQSMDSIKKLLLHSDVTNDRLRSLLVRVREVTGVSRLIDDIAARTRLLALNASIEATRAGSAGAAFGVVAGEVRELAKGTADKTKKIDELMQAIIADLEPARTAMEESRALVQQTVTSVEAVDSRLAAVNELAGTASGHVRGIAQSMQDQTQAMSTLVAAADVVVDSLQALRQEADLIAQDALSVSTATSEGQEHLARVQVDSMFHRGLAGCREYALRLGAVLDAAVDARRCTVEDVLRLDYTEILGADVRSLSHMFDVSRAPTTGFSPPKFHTAYDRAIELPMQVECDAVLAKEPKLLFAFPIDLNSYNPSHNKRYAKDFTGDKAKDLVGNRIKRFFHETKVIVRGARMGLGQVAANLPNRSTRADFQRTGCNLSETAKLRDTFLVQTYCRDTGEFVTVITVPVFVKGQRWGAGIVGWTADAVV